MTVLQPVPRQMEIDNGAMAVAIAMRRTRWGPKDVLTVPPCAGCGWQRYGRSYVN
jgi:hypothetical protein